jgi:hypothetical protein
VAGPLPTFAVWRLLAQSRVGDLDNNRRELLVLSPQMTKRIFRLHILFQVLRTQSVWQLSDVAGGSVTELIFPRWPKSSPERPKQVQRIHVAETVKISKFE